MINNIVYKEQVIFSASLLVFYIIQNIIQYIIHNTKHLSVMQKQQPILTFANVSSYLLQNASFLSSLKSKLSLHESEPISIRRQQFDAIIEQLSHVIQLLIKVKLQKQMNELITDNNTILEQIKTNLQKQNVGKNASEIQKGNSDNSFTQIHNLIHQQKKKMLDQLNDAQVEKSMSMLGQYDDFVDKVNQLQKKVKTMEDKYQTNFKSLWNVLSMTESAVFDYIKDNKLKMDKLKETQMKEGKDKSLFHFWK